MRHLSLRLFLIVGSAQLALLAALPAAAQDAPVVVAPPAPAPEATPAVVPDEPVEEAAKPPAPPIPEIWAPVPLDPEGRSAYGLYLSGRLAEGRGDRAAAADFMTRTETLTPEQPQVRDQTFLNALLAGDLGVAARLTPQGEDVSPVLSEAGRLADVIQTWADGRPQPALALMTERPISGPHARAGLLIQPWLAAASGDWDLALKPLDGAPTDPLSLIARETRAVLLEQRGRTGDAEAEFRALVAVPNGPPALRLSWAQFLERNGRRDEARAVYQALAADASPNAVAVAALARMGERRPPAPLRTPREGGAAALSLSAQQALAESAFEFAAVYLRMSQLLQPSEETRLLLGYALAGAKQELLARETWADVSPADPGLFAASRSGIASSLQRDGEGDQALSIWMQAHAADPAEPQIAFRLASALVDAGRTDDALALLNAPMFNHAQQPFPVRFLRGAALERLGRTDEAEAELWAALQLQPNDPTALNHLGYLWVDSGRRVNQGAEMIERAHQADPGNGNIQDSLGWARYHQGRYEDAVATLESAVAKEPANAEINDHLGDAYWRAGRRREASWQWNRVLILETEGERRDEAEKKLAEGLPDPAAPAVS